jgi:hypothetical protein
MAAETPEEWLPILTKRLDERRPRVDLLSSHVTGDAPLPEMGKNTRAAWARFQKEARTAFGLLVVEAITDRFVPNGVRVGDDDMSEASLAAQRIYRDNRLSVVFPDAARESFTKSVGYLIVGEDNGRAVITAESPEYVITSPDPLRPWVSRAALKVWRDVDADLDFAHVWANGVRQKFSRPILNTNRKPYKRAQDGPWTPLDVEPEPYVGNVPVFALDNKGGMGEFEPHLDILNRINRNLLQRLVTVAMQAFRQRYLTGGLPDKDDDGNDIDWAKMLEPAPGALWDLPEGIDIRELTESAQSIVAMLDAEKSDVRAFAAVTQTPLPMLAPDGQNQSAEGAAYSREGLVLKTEDRIDRFKPALALALVYALRIEGFDDVDDVEVMFEPPAYVTLSEKYAAASQATGLLAVTTIQKQILGMSQQAIREDEQARMKESQASRVAQLVDAARAVTSGGNVPAGGAVPGSEPAAGVVGPS